MKRWAPLLVLGLLGLFGVACGGSSSPTASSAPRVAATPAAEAPVVNDGWSHQPVTAEVTPPTVRSGDALLAKASGYLPREQRYDRSPVFLWPADEAYVRELVYDWEFTDGSFRMVRWVGAFTLTLDGDLAGDDAVLARAQDVVGEIQRQTDVAITIGPGGACVVKIDPSLANEDAVGEARLSFRGATIVAATVLFVQRAELLGFGRRADYRNTFLHEMGHAIGLGHSPDIYDVMTPGAGPGANVDEFQLNEAIALHMMYVHRSAGNRPPDKDVLLAPSSRATPRTVVIRD